MKRAWNKGRNMKSEREQRKIQRSFRCLYYDDYQGFIRYKIRRVGMIKYKRSTMKIVRFRSKYISQIKKGITIR